jgi:hypothetical protein
VDIGHGQATQVSIGNFLVLEATMLDKNKKGQKCHDFYANIKNVHTHL